jgi:hypothetical protein
MEIDNDQELFAAICSLFKIEKIHQILNVSDAQIRSVCTVPELEKLIIDLKGEIMKKMADRLMHRKAAVISTTRHDPSDLQSRLQRFNY